MKYKNELKVGIAILLSVIVMFLGIRYFKDIPLFGGTDEYFTRTPNAKGLIAGNEVRTSGIKIGSVYSVEYDAQEGDIEIRFRVDSEMPLPRGTEAAINGIDALTGIRLELSLGPVNNPPIEDGGLIPYKGDGEDFLADLSSRAPVLVDRVDSVLIGLDQTLDATTHILSDEQGDLQIALSSLRSSTQALNQLVRSEHARISTILTNVDSLTSNLGTIASDNRDSIRIAVSNLSDAAESMQASMNSLEQTTTRLDNIMAKIDSGEGTFGLLVNDPDLYHNLDSVAASLNELLKDLKKNPRRYLKDMSVIEIF